MPELYYSDKLYPLQDDVLQIIENAGVDFYLTGGTALSRCYLMHRYSDDLDLFLNAHPVDLPGGHRSFAWNDETAS